MAPNLERSLEWSEERTINRFRCSQCNWSHPNPSVKDGLLTLDPYVLRFVKRAFSEHVCGRGRAERTGAFLRPGHAVPAMPAFTPAAVSLDIEVSVKVEMS